MFVEVPEPVWNVSIVNWSSQSPRSDLVGGAADGVGHRRIDAGVVGAAAHWHAPSLV